MSSDRGVLQVATTGASPHIDFGHFFNYCGQQVRVVIIDNVPWWVAKVVCDVLGITWSGATLAAIPEQWRSLLKLNIDGVGARNVTIIAEPALYKLAFRSRKAEADAFTNWIASEVIPTIRKTGSYSVAPVAPALPIPQTYSEALRLAADLSDKVEALETQVQEDGETIIRLENDRTSILFELDEAKDELGAAYTTLSVVQERLSEARPKVNFYDTVADSKGLLSLNEAAKILSNGQFGNRTLIKLLREKGIFQQRAPLPYQQYMTKGYFKVKCHMSSSRGFGYSVTKVTGEGLIWLHQVFENLSVTITYFLSPT